MNRKEARRSYQEAARPAGVYRIVNRANGKSYVDATLDLRARENRFAMELRGDSLRQPTALVADLRAFGPEAFFFEVLDRLAQPDNSPGYDPAADLRALLALWLEKLEPWDARGYNTPRER